MKCRRLTENKGIVWFGRDCKNVHEDDADLRLPIVEGGNYAEDKDAVEHSLTQRLSVLKGELWYQINYGIPLLEKQKGTRVLDVVICDIITSHPAVSSLTSYSSKIVDGVYTFDCSIKTIYGNPLNIANNLTI